MPTPGDVRIRRMAILSRVENIPFREFSHDEQELIQRIKNSDPVSTREPVLHNEILILEDRCLELEARMVKVGAASS